jgi:hypothetical protein
VDKQVNDRTEESAEEVLARLERYVESRRGPSHGRAPGDRPVTSYDASVAANAVPTVDTLIPSRGPAAPHRRHFASEVAPALTSVAICSFVILLSEWFQPSVAVGAGGALMVLGVVGLVRRVALARAYTFGLIIAVVLIRFS